MALAIGLAVIFGFALNGTSSVLYAAVAGFVPEARRGRGYGLYYTGTQSAAAVAPLGYGFVADQFGLSWTFLVMATFTAAAAGASRRAFQCAPRRRTCCWIAGLPRW